MATRKKAELTDAQKATLDARQKVQLAREADNAKSTDQTKKHLAAAEEHLRKCYTNENRERFVRVGGTRFKKLRTAIRNFGAVASPRSYLYTEADIVKAETVASDEFKKMFTRMRMALTKGTPAKAEDDFTF